LHNEIHRAKVTLLFFILFFIFFTSATRQENIQWRLFDVSSTCSEAALNDGIPYLGYEPEVLEPALLRNKVCIAHCILLLVKLTGSLKSNKSCGAKSCMHVRDTSTRKSTEERI